MMLSPATLPVRSLLVLALLALGGAALWFSVQGAPGGSNWTTPGDAALPPSLQVAGDVAVTTTGDVVTKLEVPLSVRGDDGILLTEGGHLRASTVMGVGATAVVPATYSVTWSDGDGDEVLEPGELAVLTVQLPERTTVHSGNPLDLIIRPVGGVALTIEDVLG